MAISSFHNGRNVTTLVGGDGLHRADISLIGGSRRLKTDSIVTVEQLFGRPGFSSVWFALGTFEDCAGIGAAGDEIRIQIAEGCDPVEFPAIDLTYTIQASDVAATLPEIAVRDNIISMLNSDATFHEMWTAEDVKDNGIVFIESRYRAETGDRNNTGDFSVTTTGTTTATIAFDVIQRKGTETELVRSIDDPRQGILGISGSVSVIPTGFPNRFQEDARNAGDNDLTVNGSGAPVVYRIDPVPNFDIYVTQMSIHGLSNGVKFGKFLNLNSALVTGLTIDIRTDNIVTTLEAIHSTDDLKARFSSLGGFDLDVQAGGDHVLAARDLGLFPFVLRAANTFGPGQDDFFTITVNDNISQVSELFCSLEGFLREP